MENKQPYFTDEQLAYLENLYPDKAPEIHWEDRTIWIKRGEVGVIRHLKHLRKLQDENMLSSV